MTSRLTLLTIFLFTFNVNGQDLDTVTISGRVMDQSGAVIPGAEVEATLMKTGLKRRTQTDAEGRYRLFQLEPGSYALRISSPGFNTQELTNIATVSSQGLQLDATLLPANIVAAVVVA